MNTRRTIQPSDQPAVLSIDFSQTHRRIIVGTTQGCRLLQLKDCIKASRDHIMPVDSRIEDISIGIAAALDDRYVAYVRSSLTNDLDQRKLVFRDLEYKRHTMLDFHEPILGIRMSTHCLVVILSDRAIVLLFVETLGEDGLASITASRLHSLSRTAMNLYALGALRRDWLVLPAQTYGQVQLIPLAGGSKRVFKAHNTQLRALTASDDGSLVATASIQGTLIRVFDVATLDKIAEFRRGVDGAVIFSLAISPGNRWVACTSDKGTLHIFDLRPRTLPLENTVYSRQIPARPTSLVSPSIDSATRSSPPASVQYQGSVQEYYGLLPPPPVASPTSQTAAVAALSNAFKHSALAPRALKDIRSIVSMPFHMGDEDRHWQGGPSAKWTIGPDGKRMKVPIAVPPLPNEPGGKPAKGQLAFAPDPMDDDAGFVLYSVGGGSDPRWERFRLVRIDNEWKLINEGFRRYLTRQFTD